MQTFINTDADIRQIRIDVANSKGLLKDAWIEYQSGRWYPVEMTDRKSKKVGFDVNLSGDWGPNEDVGRRKFDLNELLLALANRDLPNKAAIRCKRENGLQANGRHASDLQFSERLAVVLARMRVEIAALR